MKKWKQFTSLVLIALLFFTTIPVRAEQLETDEIAGRKEKASQLGLEDWIDEEGYLLETFYEGKSDGLLSEMNLDGLVRTLTEEELEAYVDKLNAGISTYTVTRYEKVSQVNPSTGNLLYTGIFEVDGRLAYCIERSVTTPAKGSPTGSWVAVTNTNLRKVLYYGYNGPADQGYTYVETALAAGEANGDGDNALGRKVLAEIKTYAAPPSNFKVWKVETNGGKTQDLAFYTIVERGYVKVQKASTNNSMTGGNDCYSLKDAVYGIYRDAECSKLSGEVTTDATGLTNSVSLAPGTYYVKEISAPKGYLLSNAIQKCVVKEKETTVVTMKDEPITVVPELIVNKMDAETGSGTAQGDGTLGGAIFTVKFFKGNYETGIDPETLEIHPERKWTLETDSDGKIELDLEHLNSGDAFWTNADGKAVFPLGTLTIQEISPPEGYHCNEEVFVVNLNESTQVFQTIIVQEEVIQLEIIKYREGTTETLAEAGFVHAKPDGSQEIKYTDANGRIIWKGLTRGEHRIQEVDPPSGYAANENEITFVVTEENKIVITSEVDEDLGMIRTNITETGNLVVEVENKKGFKLPETGSNQMIWMGLAGVMCFKQVWKGKKSYEKKN